MTTLAREDIKAVQTTPDPSCLLEFRNIRIVYDNAIEAIRDVSIAVPEGGIVALLGSNGAGKSTLLKAMSGILYTEEGVIENGSIRFRNEEIHRLAPDELVRRGIVQAGNETGPIKQVPVTKYRNRTIYNPEGLYPHKRPQFTLAQSCHVASIEFNRSARRLDEAEKETSKRRLPTPRRPDECDFEDRSGTPDRGELGCLVAHAR